MPGGLSEMDLAVLFPMAGAEMEGYIHLVHVYTSLLLGIVQQMEAVVSGLAAREGICFH